MSMTMKSDCFEPILSNFHYTLHRTIWISELGICFGLLKLKLSVLTLSQRLVTPRTPRISGARLGVQPLQLPEIPIHYKWGPQ